MIELFDKHDKQNASTTLPGFYDEMQIKTRSDTNSCINYLRDHGLSLKSNHVLVRILSTLNVDPNKSIFENLRFSQDKRDQVCRRHNINTHQATAGVLEKGLLYGKNTHELWVDLDLNVEALNASKYWQNLRPIRILRHPINNPIPPLMPLDKGKKGLAIIGIDVVTLSIQYYYWLQEQLKLPEDDRQTSRQFLLSFPIANSFIDHTDLAIFNRIVDNFNLKEPTEYTDYDWPMRFASPEPIVNRYVRDRVDRLLRSDTEFETMLQEIQLIYHTDLFEKSRLPRDKRIRTQQISWVYWLIIKPYLSFLLQVDFERGSARNRSHRAQIQKELENLWSNRQLSLLIGPSYYYDFVNEMRDGIEQYIK